MKISINHHSHIPYGAGTSKSGKEVFIDKDIPHYFQFKDGRVDVWKALEAHETAEDAQMRKGMHYEDAHRHYAIPAEKKEVGKHWKEYNSRIDTLIGEDKKMQVKKLPSALEKKPYREEHYKSLAIKKKIK